MSQRHQLSIVAWSYLLLGSLLLIAPWSLPLLLLRWRDWCDILTADVWLTVPVVAWLAAMSFAGLALIVLAFRRRP
jgi:hypothetical protein